jgi:hypothetical protein
LDDAPPFASRAERSPQSASLQPWSSYTSPRIRSGNGGEVAHLRSLPSPAAGEGLGEGAHDPPKLPDLIPSPIHGASPRAGSPLQGLICSG